MPYVHGHKRLEDDATVTPSHRPDAFWIKGVKMRGCLLF